jgi:hypothetical protein
MNNFASLLCQAASSQGFLGGPLFAPILVTEDRSGRVDPEGNFFEMESAPHLASFRGCLGPLLRVGIVFR